MVIAAVVHRPAEFVEMTIQSDKLTNGFSQQSVIHIVDIGEDGTELSFTVQLPGCSSCLTKHTQAAELTISTQLPYALLKLTTFQVRKPTFS
jgi:hypothetical protein